MDGIWVALISLVGTAIGTFGGIITSNRLTVYRIECLEKKVDKHNSLIDRMYKLEGRVGALEGVYDEKFKVANHRIEDLENK